MKLFKILLCSLLMNIGICQTVVAQDDCPAGATRNLPVSPLDHDYMVRAFKASFRGIKGYDPSMKPGAGIEDGEYYISASNHYGVYGDGQCHAGWSGYWEAWIRSGHGDLGLVQTAAQFLPSSDPQPVPVPTPTPAPLPTVQVCDLSTVLMAVQQVNANVTDGRAENRAFYDAVGIQWKKITVFVAKYGSAIVAGILARQATK